MYMTAARRLGPFFIWLAVFYSVWAALVLLGDRWHTVADHWPIAAGMAVGSYFAGSTPMGGGTVGFPILVLMFELPASLGRDFGLAVQSIGMVSASIFILASRKPVDRPLLKWGLIGTLIGTPFGAAYIAPYASEVFVKLLFGAIWCSFGIIHLLKLRAIVQPEGERIPERQLDRPIGLGIGITGGLVSSLTGVGIDMLLYAMLVLFYRSDIKVAIPTSVILMAATSVIGILTNLGLGTLAPQTYAVSPDVFNNWLAAAPVVALGAPFGVFIVARLPRAPTLRLVSALCVLQFVWMIARGNVPVTATAAAIAGILLMNVIFLALFRIGEARASATHMPIRTVPAE